LYLSILAFTLTVRPSEAVVPEGGAVELARLSWQPALLGRESVPRFEALDQMRADPELARQALLLAATSPDTGAGRWRLTWLLEEFGHVEDIPALLTRAALDTDARDQRFTLAAARALYPGYDQPADLSRTVGDFSFIQTRPPQAFELNKPGTYSLTPHVFDEYHRTGVPIETIIALRPLRERTFNDRGSLSQAMQKSLGATEWKTWQETLLAQLEPAPPRAVLEGLLRVQIVNPGDRPLLVRAGFGIWRGQFEADPPTALLYAAPGGEARLEQPVRIIAPVQERGVRIDLRLRELYQAPQPLYRRLTVPVAVNP
jgi:hypothetical protein